MTNHPDPQTPQPSSNQLEHAAPQQNPYLDHLQQHISAGQPAHPAGQPWGNAGHHAGKAEKPARSFLLTVVLVGAVMCIGLRVAEYLVTLALANDLASWVTNQANQYEALDRNAVLVPTLLLSGSQGVFLLISVVISSLLYCLFGVFAFMGRNWARIMLTLLAIIGVLMSALKFWGYSVARESLQTVENSEQFRGYMGVLLVIYGALCVMNLLMIVLPWLPPANSYVRKLRAYRYSTMMMVQPVYHMQQYPGTYVYQVPGYVQPPVQQPQPFEGPRS